MSSNGSGDLHRRFIFFRFGADATGCASCSKFWRYMRWTTTGQSVILLCNFKENGGSSVPNKLLIMTSIKWLSVVAVIVTSRISSEVSNRYFVIVLCVVALTFIRRYMYVVRCLKFLWRFSIYNVDTILDRWMTGAQAAYNYDTRIRLFLRPALSFLDAYSDVLSLLLFLRLDTKSNDITQARSSFALVDISTALWSNYMYGTYGNCQQKYPPFIWKQNGKSSNILFVGV